jgi:hypothetical protein
MNTRQITRMYRLITQDNSVLLWIFAWSGFSYRSPDHSDSDRDSDPESIRPNIRAGRLVPRCGRRKRQPTIALCVGLQPHHGEASVSPRHFLQACLQAIKSQNPCFLRCATIAWLMKSWCFTRRKWQASSRRSFVEADTLVVKGILDSDSGGGTLRRP